MDLSWVFLVAVGVWVVMKVLGGRRSGAQLVEIKAAIDAGAQLVDVRSAGEFSSGHLPKARNIPVQQLAMKMGGLKKDKPVVVYCASGARSASAARLLRSAGFSAVLDLGPMRNGVQMAG